MKILKKVFFISVVIYLLSFLYLRPDELSDYRFYVIIPAIVAVLTFLGIVGITVKSYAKQPLEILNEVLLFVFCILFTIILIQVL